MAYAASSGQTAPVLVGLVGRGIGPSRTPAMHEAAARVRGLPYVYRLLDVDRMNGHPQIDEIVGWAERLGFCGLNVTYPFKQAILPLLTELAPEAAALGAVNTVLFRDSKRIGHNTDYWGFRTSFAEAVANPGAMRVLLVGTGGAGVAVAQALIDLKVRGLLVNDADSNRAKALAQRLNTADCPVTPVDAIDAATLSAVDGVVNATPIGMAKAPGAPFDADLLARRHFVADIVYFPLETALLRAARAKGCLTITGEGMAIQQAVKAFELFAGVTPDAAVMRDAFHEFDRRSPAA